MSLLSYANKLSLFVLLFLIYACTNTPVETTKAEIGKVSHDLSKLLTIRNKTESWIKEHKEVKGAREQYRNIVSTGNAILTVFSTNIKNGVPTANTLNADSQIIQGHYDEMKKLAGEDNAAEDAVNLITLIFTIVEKVDKYMADKDKEFRKNYANDVIIEKWCPIDNLKCREGIKGA